MLRAGCSDTSGAFFAFLPLVLRGGLKFSPLLFHEYEVYCKNQEQYCHKVIPLQ